MSKIIEKLIDRILLDPSAIDSDPHSNLQIIEALQTTLIAQFNYLNAVKGSPFEIAPNVIKSTRLVDCVKALETVCFQCPAVFNSSSFKPLFTHMIKLYKFSFHELSSATNCFLQSAIVAIATKIRSYKLRFLLADFFLDSISNYTSKCFNNGTFHDLVVAIKCLESFNKTREYLICNKDVKIIVVSRKIWLLLNNLDSSEILDFYKCEFLNLWFEFALFDPFNNTQSLSLCLEFCDELIESNSHLPTKLQYMLSTRFLETYLACLRTNLTSFFFNSLSFQCLSLQGLVPEFGKCIMFLVQEQPKYQMLCENLKHSANISNVEFEDKYNSSISEQIQLAQQKISETKAIKNLLIVPLVDEPSKTIIESSLWKHEDTFESCIDSVEELITVHGSELFNSSLSTLKLFSSLGLLSCLCSKNYDFNLQHCLVCQSDVPKHQPNSLVSKLLNIIITRLINNSQVLTNESYVISLLISLRQILLKINIPSISGESDPLFTFLCDCLCSKNREIRLCAGRIVPFYVADYENEDNWLHVFNFLDKHLMSDDSLTYLGESKIILWGELAIVSQGEHLNVILAKLFDFLSSTNSFFTCAAYSTLINVAKMKNITCWQLINPFLPNLSFIMVQQIVKKTIFGGIIPEFLNVSSNDILFRTSTYTVPYFLTYYSKDVIKEIAKVAKFHKYEIVKQELPKILAVMLTSLEYLEVRNDPNPSYIVDQDKLMEILSIVDPYFKGKRLKEFIETRNVQLIWEICKMYSLIDDNYNRIKNSIVFVIKLANSKDDKYLRYDLSVNNADDDKILQDCFKSTLLGIVQLFSDIVQDTRGKTPYLEKLKSLIAIEFLVQISGGEIVTALPQICISLQKAISDPLLELHCLRCWRILILNLRDIHLSTCFDLVIAIVLQRWASFSKNSKKVAKEVLIELFKKKTLIKEKYFNYYFTLSFNDSLTDVYLKANSILRSRKSTASGSMVFNLFYDIMRRCRNDNKYVVQQALTDLNNFLNQYKDEFHSSLLRKNTFIDYVPALIDILMKNCSKFKGAVDPEEMSIPKQCTKCLGMIGSLDPDKFEFSEKEKELVCKFNSGKDLLQFTVKLLNLLSKAFWASEDPGLQIFLAYGMQEFIKLTGITSLSSISSFNDLTVSTLTPLATSRYELSSTGVGKTQTYPIFKRSKSHKDWVREFTLDLLKRSEQNCSETEFKNYESHFYSIYSSIIRGQDLNISLAILPYLTLNMIVKNVDNSRANILNEFLLILRTDCDEEYLTHEISENVKLFYQTVFKIIDYLTEWLADRKSKRQSSGRNKKLPLGDTQEVCIKLVTESLEQIPEVLIATRSSQCNSYERAILYLEQSYRLGSNDYDLGLVLKNLQTMYERVDDYDALLGSLRKLSKANIESFVSEMQYEDNWESTLGIFEALDTESKNDFVSPKYLTYLNKKNLYSETLQRLSKYSMENKMFTAEVVSAALQAAIMEADREALELWISRSGLNISINDSEIIINSFLSKALLAMKDNDDDTFNYALDKSHDVIISALSLSPSSSLSRNKQLINKLHVLNDLKELSMVKSKGDMAQFNKIFKARVENSASDFESPWYILTLRATGELFNHGNLSESVISDVYLQRSKLELEHNRLDLASRSAVYSYKFYNNHEAELQYAEILWKQGDYSKALKMAHSLKEVNPDDRISSDMQSRVQLKYAYWLESSNNALGDEIIKEYNLAIEKNPTWEDPYYYLGKYYIKVLESETSTEEDGATSRGTEVDIIKCYLSSIKNGSKYLEEIFPKVITLWIDLSYASSKRKSGSHMILSTSLELIEKEILKACEILPHNYWFSVFSQLLSRLPSTSGSTFNVIVKICATLAQYYPEQCLWSIFAQYNSNDKKRSAAGKKIVLKFIALECRYPIYKSNSHLFNLASRALTAFHKMTKYDKGRGVREASMKDDYKFDHSVAPAPIVVPCKQNFDMINSTSSRSRTITITKFEDRVKVMTSLQRPRRINVIGSDGKTYSILFKLKDDLRKDAKLMELTGMIDHLLTKDYESKKRYLKINTFAVVPLNETYGIIEWVQHHVTLKSILDKGYERKDSLLNVRKKYATKKTLAEKLSIYKELLEYYPPVLYRWFIEFFPSPSAWYNSRNTFVRTCAVMSMLGYVLGIGDRHGENILISETDGGILHVDFDCLFEKGKTLKVPERVPFRLTNNIVDAFGIFGVEGTFRKSSEVTMSLLRNNETILMNILEAFIHDPIMDWTGGNGRIGSPEQTLFKIRSKLRGIIEKEALPMSISGQVNYLIQEATSSELLCQMYFGWLPFW